MQAPAWNLCIVELPVDRVAGLPATLRSVQGGESALSRLTRSTSLTIPICPHAGLVRQCWAERGR
jgi:hypothetical protein